MTKRRVTMTSIAALPDGQTATQTATDYVPADILDAYLADARTRWQSVAVSDEVDHGPGGKHGPTATLEHLAHGVTLQQHLHHIGAKPFDDPSNPR